MNKFFKYIAVAVVMLSGAMAFTACGEDTYITEEYYGAYSKTEYFPIKASDWDWNEAKGRYEFFVDVKSLNQHIYDNGAIIGSIFIDPKSAVETQHSLPFVHTYRDGEDYKYTETISFDAQPGSIGFYIQASDLASDDYVLADYEFKIIMFWE